MSGAPLKVAIVGHTNTGKTSLIRTLTRDPDFGEVSIHPGTTRHVEGTELLAAGEPVLALFDTPGLEDPMTLLDYLEQPEHRRLDGVERIERFLASAGAHAELSQEAKVLRQVMASDVALYVVDARESVLGKYRDELTILTYSARPVLPVLNFVASADAKPAEWRSSLARLGLHAVVAFDTVLFDPVGERRLFEQMQSVLEAGRERLQRLIDERARTWRELERGAAATLADLLIDAAAVRIRVDGHDAQALAQRGRELQDRAREREQACVTVLIEMFGFRPGDFQVQGLPIVEGRWQIDLFAPEVLPAFGVAAGGGAAAGAAIGLGIDVLTGGLSLGAAAALGAVLGASWGTLGRFGGQLLDRIRGYVELRVDDATLRVLAARQLWLIRTLLRRGHASLTPVRVEQAGVDAPWQRGPLPEPLRRARNHPHWSRIAPEDASRLRDDAARQAALRALREVLLDSVSGPDRRTSSAASPPGV